MTFAIEITWEDQDIVFGVDEEFDFTASPPHSEAEARGAFQANVQLQMIENMITTAMKEVTQVSGKMKEKLRAELEQVERMERQLQDQTKAYGESLLAKLETINLDSEMQRASKRMESLKKESRKLEDKVKKTLVSAVNPTAKHPKSDEQHPWL